MQVCASLSHTSCFHFLCRSAIALCNSLGCPHDIALVIGSEAAKRSQHGAIPHLSIKDAVAAMNNHMLLHESSRVQSVGFEKSDAPILRSTNQGWSPPKLFSINWDEHWCSTEWLGTHSLVLFDGAVQKWKFWLVFLWLVLSSWINHYINRHNHVFIRDHPFQLCHNHFNNLLNPAFIISLMSWALIEREKEQTNGHGMLVLECGPTFWMLS